jgi:hypothetical protein
MNYSGLKSFKSVDFIGLGVFFAHIKNRLYTQGVAKISQKENN